MDHDACVMYKNCARRPKLKMVLFEHSLFATLYMWDTFAFAYVSLVDVAVDSVALGSDTAPMKPDIFENGLDENVTRFNDFKTRLMNR